MLRDRLICPMLVAALLAGCETPAPARPATEYERGYRDGSAARRHTTFGPIAVTRASYGSWSRSCDATALVSSQASGKFNFRLAVSNNLCGDPHQGKSKSLDVSYQCGSQSKTASAREHDTLTLACP